VTVLRLLDDYPADETPGAADAWVAQVEHSLRTDRVEWSMAVMEVDRLSDDRAWTLLSWIESSATRLVRARSGSTLAVAAFGTSLLMRSWLDRRDIAVVAALLRRGADLVGLNYIERVAEGCSWAAEGLGRAALDLLMRAPASASYTHVEIGDGVTFAFERRPPDFDVADLERWLEGDAG
jgi:hypothetical protein